MHIDIYVYTFFGKKVVTYASKLSHTEDCSKQSSISNIVLFHPFIHYFLLKSTFLCDTIASSVHLTMFYILFSFFFFIFRTRQMSVDFSNGPGRQIRSHFSMSGCAGKWEVFFPTTVPAKEKCVFQQPARVTKN